VVVNADYSFVGVEAEETLIHRRREEQLIFITGHGDISMCSGDEGRCGRFSSEAFQGIKLTRSIVSSYQTYNYEDILYFNISAAGIRDRLGAGRTGGL
jgi:hypothetical protein